MYLDYHTHLYSYGEHLDKALAIMEEKEILALDCTVDLEDYLFSRKISARDPNVLTGFGIHPWKAFNCHEVLEIYDPYVEQAPFIGEIGLDFHWVKEKYTYTHQWKVCDHLLGKSAKMNKMCNLHTKGAEEEVDQLIRKHHHPKPVIHWYSGPRHVFDRMLDYGCRFTIGVDVLTSKRTREMVERLPLERILTETDGMEAKKWLTGEPGFPDDIIKVVQSIARIKESDEESVIRAVWKNGMEWLNNN